MVMMMVILNHDGDDDGNMQSTDQCQCCDSRFSTPAEVKRKMQRQKEHRLLNSNNNGDF